MRFSNTTRLFLAAAACAALLPHVALAQVRDLDAEPSDVRVYQGEVDGAAERFVVSIPAGAIMQIDVIGRDDFDPVLRVKDAASGELIDEDDDGGDDLNSRLRIPGEGGRRIAIEVDSYEGEYAADTETYGGPFDLRLTTSTYSPPVTRPIAYGGRATGTIDGAEELYAIEGEAGQMVEIALLAESDGLDPYLALRDPSGETALMDDDGGQELNSALRYVFPESGTYTIVATGYNGSTGDYVLRVRERRQPAAQLPQQVIGLDDPATGELADSATDQTLIPASITYRLSEEAKAAIVAGGAGERAITVHMNASDGGDPDFGSSIDPYLEVGFDTPMGFSVLDTDDDGAGNLDALLPIDLSGVTDAPRWLDDLRIRATGLSGTSGPYTLTVTQGLEERVDPADALEEQADMMETMSVDEEM
ncbi:PPC domain-containing protein [Aurantiacibacter spongiae]|uniref:Peptidase C-terminal archaeal/bacterial domain-containing protein n=1 Tax=Aurantiacibacter spongiae TaxID=2488860 RepID=A0A3N5CP38_9SPHN|nr:PPC domain-containing protein [Aurantiacibacter spongiae]RPF70734.1 hypothetical protein EG799_03190 [Aurantiacibacter spongiae]